MCHVDLVTHWCTCGLLEVYLNTCTNTNNDLWNELLAVAINFQILWPRVTQGADDYIHRSSSFPESARSSSSSKNLENTTVAEFQESVISFKKIVEYDDGDRGQQQSIVAWGKSDDLWYDKVSTKGFHTRHLQFYSFKTTSPDWEHQCDCEMLKDTIANARQGHQKNTALALAVVKLYLSVQVSGKRKWNP